RDPTSTLVPLVVVMMGTAILLPGRLWFQLYTVGCIALAVACGEAATPGSFLVAGRIDEGWLGMGAAAFVSLVVSFELGRQRSRLELILDSTGDGLYGIDAAGRCTFVNPAALQML